METSANLVIQTAFLGDLILSVPTLRRIKKKFPDEKLIVLCRAGIGRFLVEEGLADDIVEVRKSDSRSYEEALRALRRYRIKYLYCLHRSARSILFSAGLPAYRKIGFSSFLGFWVFDDCVSYLPENPEVLRQMKILETTDEEVSEQINSGSFAYLNEPDGEGQFSSIPEFFNFPERRGIRADGEVRVALFPGSVWETKKWTVTGYAELCRKLLADGVRVSLMGGAAEEGICKDIADAAPGSEVVAGKLTIEQSLGYLQNCDLVICNDSASTHMAAFARVPVITIFGPTTSRMGFRPWIDGSYAVENTTMSCRPCGRHGHQKCPLGHHLCMKSIQAQAVYKKACRILGKN